MKLSVWLSDHGITQADFATKIGSSQPQVARFSAGNRIPAKEVMQKIAEVTAGAVSADDFYDLRESDEMSPNEDAAA